MLSLSYEAILDLALTEDLASGDLTTESCIEADTKAVAHAVARKAMVACGGFVFARVFEKIDASVSFEAHVEEGAHVSAGARLWTVRGSARSILMGERTALNFVQRMCGIATNTRNYVSALPQGSRTHIIDTRKTTPGLRVLERYAVRCGGGHNHRDNLSSAILIKDNHIRAAGSITAAIERSKKHAPHTSKIECEVESLAGLDEAIAAGADIVLLDNMDTPTMQQAVERAKGRVILEASGGITVERVRELGALNVDLISVGALTHSVPSCDIGLDFE